MYGLIVNNVLKQKQEAKAKGFVTIPHDAICGQVTLDGGVSFTNPPLSPVQIPTASSLSLPATVGLP